MRLFAPDLYRNFGIGFAIGAIALGLGAIDAQDGGLESPARAAEIAKAPAPSAEFVIAPETAR